MLDLGYLAAFLGGVLTLVSPCGALLLPSFFAYAFAGRSALVARTAVFLAGMALVLVPLGAGASALAGLLTLHRDVLVTVAGVVLVMLGLVQILGGGWALAPAARAQARAAERLGPAPGRPVPRTGTWVATGVLGAVYGLAGFCSGPILGAVLTVAAAGGAPVRGGALLAVYAVGMTVPLFVLALLWERFDLGRRRWLRGREYRLGPLRLHTTTTVAGLVFVVIGVVFVAADGTAALLGLDPERSAAAEGAVLGLGRAVPDVVLLGALAVVVVVVVLVRLARGRREEQRSADVERDAAG